MNDDIFTVMIAGITKPGMESYVKHYLKEIMEHSQKDPGCLTYNIHQSIDNPCEFMVYMQWTSQQSFEKHNKKPEMQEFKHKLSNEMFEQQSPKTYWYLIK